MANSKAVLIANASISSQQKLIGAIIIFFTVVASVFPSPYNVYVLQIALALSGAATFYFGTQIVPSPIQEPSGNANTTNKA